VALDRLIHDLIYGVTGMDPTLIRPRYVPEPANMPPADTDWAAFGIQNRVDDHHASQTFSDLGMTVSRSQEIEVLCSFYGPNATHVQGLLKEGLSLSQNREYMNSQGIAFVSISETRNASMLINQRWNKRMDCVLTLRRYVSRLYPILSLTGSEPVLNTDTLTSFSEPIIVTNP
jgi:hypothetical protein